MIIIKDLHFGHTQELASIVTDQMPPSTEQFQAFKCIPYSCRQFLNDAFAPRTRACYQLTVLSFRSF